MAAAAFMVLKTAALPRQPPPEFASRHEGNIESGASQATEMLWLLFLARR